MSGWTVVDGHAVRTATLILSGMVGALVLVVFIMGGHERVWWAGLVALAGCGSMGGNTKPAPSANTAQTTAPTPQATPAWRGSMRWSVANRCCHR